VVGGCDHIGVVRRVHDGGAALDLAGDRLPDEYARLVVETRGRLVEKHDIRTLGQALRHEHPLALAAR
jgi:hypothetical protein